MTFHSLLIRATALVSTSLLVASCGGGSDADAGGLVAFNIVPTSITLTGPDANTCGGGYGGRVFVYGGAGPYRIDNTGAGFVAVSRNVLDRPGDSFDVTLGGGCMTNIQVVVVDQLGRQAALSVTSVKGQ